MQEAHYYYLRWGASAKVRDLEVRYPQFFSSVRVTYRDLASQALAEKVSINTSSEALDLATVIKAYQAISSEIALDELLSKLIKIAVENAGAQSGSLLLQNEESKLLLEASITFNDRSVKQSLPIDNCDRLPLSVINYVARTLEDVVLNDATSEGIFTSDLYIVKHQPVSVLCIPIQAQGSLRGILYLENNLTTGAFTPERISVLKWLVRKLLSL